MADKTRVTSFIGLHPEARNAWRNVPRDAKAGRESSTSAGGQPGEPASLLSAEPSDECTTHLVTNPRLFRAAARERVGLPGSPSYPRLAHQPVRRRVRLTHPLHDPLRLRRILQLDAHRPID